MLIRQILLFHTKMSSSSAPAAATDGGGDTTDSSSSYYQSQIPPEIATMLEAGAFRSLCQHLQQRSDEVQNIDLMTLSGFCRNCLAKWLVLESRKLSDELKAGNDGGVVLADIGSNEAKRASIIQALDALGYDETAEEVYGCTYPEWKKRHAKKASDEQMEKYNESKPLHATHDTDMLKVRAEKSAVVATVTTAPNSSASSAATSEKASLLSDVCCEDIENIAARPTGNKSTGGATCSIGGVTPNPPKGGIDLKIVILTVSDRAAANEYETGDLSGPAVESSLETIVGEMNAKYRDGNAVKCGVVAKSIVPDDIHDIKKTLLLWSGKSEQDTSATCDIIITTGGTGFSPRDVTPEATQATLDRENRGLMGWVSSECSATQPLAALSRGTAGMCGKTLIANLPGSPAGVAQVMQILFPLLVHAAKDIQTSG